MLVGGDTVCQLLCGGQTDYNLTLLLEHIILYITGYISINNVMTNIIIGEFNVQYCRYW